VVAGIAKHFGCILLMSSVFLVNEQLVRAQGKLDLRFLVAAIYTVLLIAIQRSIKLDGKALTQILVKVAVVPD
jgi:hypothetical protein